MAYYIIRLAKYSIWLFHFQAIVYFLIARKYNYLLLWNQLDLGFQICWKRLEQFWEWFLTGFNRNDVIKYLYPYMVIITLYYKTNAIIRNENLYFVF